VKRVAIRTQDFQLAYRLIKKFKDLKIPHIQLGHNQNVPKSVFCWFGSFEEVQCSNDKRGIACNANNVSNTINKTLNRLFAGPDVKVLNFGVDTGPRPGLAWFADNRFIGCMQLEYVDEVANKISQIIGHISPKYPNKSLVRVGNGPRTISNRIVNSCLNYGFDVELVDENNTSSGSRHDHVSSAKSIGSKSGVSISNRLKVSPTRGEVREIQRISRLLSEGKTTIPSKLAASVAIGNLSLIEAVNLHSQ